MTTWAQLYWTCRSCGLTNPRREKRCHRCHTKRPDKEPT